MSNNKRSSNFSRGLAIMDFILEGNGHSIKEATEEFKISRSTIEADLNYLGQEVFYGICNNQKNLQKKYIDMRKTLKKLAKEHHANNLPNVKTAASN